MKVLIFFLIVSINSSCTKVQLLEIPLENSTKNNINGIEVANSKYAEEIDVIVAFLWPEKISTSTQKLGLEKIISSSRILVVKKEEFLNQKIALQKLFNSNYCNCALNDQCNGSEPALDINKCYQIEESIYKNDEKLVEIFGYVELIKKTILEIGGEWLETHLDIKNVPSSKVDLLKNNISFSALGSYQVDGSVLPYSYFIKSVGITQELGFKKINFSMPRILYRNEIFQDYGEWTVNLSMTENKASVLFQGDLDWKYEGQTRRGVIFWENPLKDIEGMKTPDI
jgi:hypothetical protein